MGLKASTYFKGLALHNPSGSNFFLSCVLIPKLMTRDATGLRLDYSYTHLRRVRRAKACVFGHATDSQY